MAKEPLAGVAAGRADPVEAVTSDARVGHCLRAVAVSARRLPQQEETRQRTITEFVREHGPS